MFFFGSALLKTLKEVGEAAYTILGQFHHPFDFIGFHFYRLLKDLDKFHQSTPAIRTSPLQLGTGK